MEPALPDRPSGDGADDPWLSADDVGSFEQGTGFSRWALARYLVGRAIAESVSRTLLVVVVGLLAIAALFEWGLHSTLLAVLVVIVALVVLVLRTALRAILRSLTAADKYGPVEAKLRSLVADTRGDVLRELRRVGLPGHAITLPLLALRLFGKRRRSTIERMRSFEVERAVPKSRLDELHMLLRGTLGGPPGGPAAPGTMYP